MDAKGKVTTLANEENAAIFLVNATPAGEVFFVTREHRTVSYGDTPRHIWRIINGEPVKIATFIGQYVYGMTVDPRTLDLYLSVEDQIIRIDAKGNQQILFNLGPAYLTHTAFDGTTLWLLHIYPDTSEDKLYRWDKGQEGEPELVLSTDRYYLQFIKPIKGGLLIPRSHGGSTNSRSDGGLATPRSRFSSTLKKYCSLDLFDPETGTFSTFSGGEQALCEYRDGDKDTARYNPISHITQGSDGNLYVTHYDNPNFVVRKVTPEGEATTYVTSAPQY